MSSANNRYTFNSIQPVPALDAFLDVVLSRTQRKTPTVVHKGYSISRIREFYLRKVKFTGSTFDEKLGAILDEFPRLDDIHPFYADLMNILYDKDHYKLALGQINTARHLIENIGKEYCKLLKFGDSLYRCKQLKRAALGRMATVMKRQKESLAYLEEVRQHLSRLPSIDPNTRTLLLCGFPNVGKSSFMNLVTRADVDVQPYAFTTKSLFVGHMDYKYLRWQVIDTPGILDRPLEDRNTIEMQSITALAHLRATVMYFLDVSGSCGYTVTQQVNLFKSIMPLFQNKPILLVLSKIDLVRPESLEASGDGALIQSLVDQGIQTVQMSSVTMEGVMDVRNTAAEKLLAMRVEQKARSGKLNDVLNRLHLASPMPRDDKQRPAFIPAGVAERRQQKNDPSIPPRVLAKDVEVANGGAGVYSVNLKEQYMLRQEQWKMDDIPEIMNGKNIADFVDPEIEAHLLRLEAEEEALEAAGAYDESADILTEEQTSMRNLARRIRHRQKILRLESKSKQNATSRPILLSRHKQQAGRVRRIDTPDEDSLMNVDSIRQYNRMLAVKEKKDRSRAGLGSSSCAMDGDDQTDSVSSRVQTVQRMGKVAQKKRNQDARRGESDRRVLISRPKHLFSGKRSNGTASHR